MKILINVKKLVDYDEVYEEHESDYRLEDFKLFGEDVIFRKPVHANFHLTRVRSGILMDGNIETTVELTCVRCLKRFEQQIEAEIHEAYSLPGMEENFEGYDDIYPIESQTDIDIEPALHSNIVVNIPTNPICSSDCKGICPICGADLNETSCNCSEEKIDPRLEILKKLKESL
jgi:uncharacterized protein